MSTETLETWDASDASAGHFIHTLMRYVRIAWYRRNIIIACSVVGLVLGGLYFATAERRYSSSAEILVMESASDVTATSMSQQRGGRNDLMPTFQRLFTSNVVLERAVDYIPADQRVDLAKRPREKWASVIAKNMSVRTIPSTKMIEVRYESKSPYAAASVVRSLVQSYQEFMDETHKGTTGQIIAVLQQEKASLETTLQQKQEELLQARKQFGDLGLSGENGTNHPLVETAIRLNEMMVENQVQRLDIEASLLSLEKSIAAGESLQQHVMLVENAVGRQFMMSSLGLDPRDTQAQLRVQQNLLQNRAQLRSLERHLGPAHPDVIEIIEEIREGESFLANSQSRINAKLESVTHRQLGPLLSQLLNNRLNESWARDRKLRAAFEEAKAEAVAMNGDLARLTILESDLQWLEGLREIMRSKLAETDLRQASGDVIVKVVRDPKVMANAVHPKLPLTMFFAMLIGLGGGLAIVYVLDVLDDHFQSPEEMRDQLGLPVLSIVRKLETATVAGMPGLHVVANPDAPDCESFRTLRTTLVFQAEDSTRLVVSSSEPGDGKTTVLANLAASYAQSGKRTLLIDGDLRRPGLTTLLLMKGMDGLADVLRSEEDVETMLKQSIVGTEVEGLDVLPAGRRRRDPSELLASGRLEDVLVWAETIYDQIIVDSPPVLAASDAVAIGKLVDGAILVVQPEKNHRRLVTRAAETFSTLGVPVLGLVANRVDPDKSKGYGYGYGYSYDYSGDSDHLEFEEEVSTAVPSDLPPYAAGGGSAIVPRKVA